jgi:ABC-type branched-subunit amino acid transport system substrate-binding protein
MATIYSMQNKPVLKREAFFKLTAEYPESEYAQEARFELVNEYYHTGQFREVILQSSDLIKYSENENDLCRTFEILGDTYLALSSAHEAIYFYENAKRISNPTEESRLETKLKIGLGFVEVGKYESILKSAVEDTSYGSLIFDLAVVEYERGNYKNARSLFTEFYKRFPDHGYAGEADSFIEDINQTLAFNRNLIGCVLPLSGPYQSFGEKALKAIELALGQYNTRQGVPVFQLIVKDTCSDPAKAVSAIAQLEELKVALVIGPLKTSRDAASEAQRRQFPIITLTQQSGIHNIGDFVFRNFLTPEMQIDTIVPYAIEELGVSRFAILHPEENYGSTFMTLFRDKALEYGATVIGVEAYDPEQTDFSLNLKRLSNPITAEDYTAGIIAPGRKNRHKTYKLDVDFDAVFIPDSPAKAGLIAPQLSFWDIDDVLLLGTNLWHSHELTDMASDYVQGAIIADMYFAASSDGNVIEFIESFLKQYGENPGFIEAIAYDTAMIAIHALDNPLVKSRNDLKDELFKIKDFEGVTGLTSFTEDGDTLKRLRVLQIRGNTFVELDRDL